MAQGRVELLTALLSPTGRTVAMPMKPKQEAQLPLRNRASAMYFLVANLLPIAEMTYSYANHLRSLRPMSRLICYTYSE